MLTLNMSVGSSVSIGESNLKLHKVHQPTELNGWKAKPNFVLYSKGQHPVPFSMPSGSSTQLIPDVVLHVFKSMIGKTTMVRIGIDAPKHIPIENETGRPTKISLNRLSNDDLIIYGRKWAKTLLEDELLNRLEDLQ